MHVYAGGTETPHWRQSHRPDSKQEPRCRDPERNPRSHGIPKIGCGRGFAITCPELYAPVVAKAVPPAPNPRTRGTPADFPTPSPKPEIIAPVFPSVVEAPHSVAGRRRGSQPARAVCRTTNLSPRFETATQMHHKLHPAWTTSCRTNSTKACTRET